MSIRLSRRKELVYASISAVVLAVMFLPTSFEAIKIPSAEAQAYERVVDARDRVDSTLDRVEETVNENASDNIQENQNNIMEIFNSVLQRLAGIFGI